MPQNTNLVPTTIVNVNGTVTTVHKKPATGANAKNLPAPGMLSGIASAFGVNRDKKRLMEQVLQQLTSQELINDYQCKYVMEKIKRVKDPGYLPALTSVLDAATNEDDMLHLLDNVLINADSQPNIRTIHMLANHLDIIAENPGNMERLDRLHGIASHDYMTKRDPYAENPLLETHFKAKVDYPHGNLGYSIDYEMHKPYYRAVEKHPESVDMLIAFVRSNPKHDLTERSFQLLLDVKDNMPERFKEFYDLVTSKGIMDARNYLQERGAEEFDAVIMEGYLGTHSAINEGWL